ncbi:hypothetical protein [Fibrella forsythiae]|uniref:Uncharacterized protein n=1 Tax=Fibrella forsythiae TaxID=2817061 RepID=A0ABS3JLH3_9BACT|nr:hypothetical protein [Fibrella forsythiae]MBO0950856.1 hypothetical protein [Fibrella forsythiae]
MTRYEQLQRISSDVRTEARHIALFHAITESWVTDGLKQCWEVDHKNLMKLSRLKGSTYRKTLKELADWSHIDYTPSSNRHVKTTINFQLTTPDSDTVNQVTAPESRAVKYCKPVTTPEFTTVNRFTTPDSSAVSWGTTPECNKVRLFTTPKFSEVTLFYRVTFWHGNAICSHPAMILGENGSESDSSSVHNIINLTNRLIISEKVDSKVVGKEKRVKGKKPKSTKMQVSSVGCKFTESHVFDPLIFTNAFRDDDRYKGVDLDYYRQRILNWRDKSGAEPIRTDWLVVARTFMLNDLKESKLKMLDTTKSLRTNASRNTNLSSNSQAIIPATNEKRSFGKW